MIKMQDNVKLVLTEKEKQILKSAVDDFFAKLDKMTKEERMAYFKEMCPEKYLNFEKEINGKVYQVNTFFNKDSKEDILTQILRIIRNEN